MDLQFSTSAWLLLIAALIAGVYVVLLYIKKPQEEFSKKWQWILASIRFLSVFLICTLLFSPWIKTHVKQIEKPFCFLSVDSSSSMNSSVDKSKLKKQLAQLERNLEEDFEVRTLEFGKQTSSTDYSELFENIYNQTLDKNTGVVVLLSDGNYNKGSDPFYAYKKIAYPLYTVTFGDTTLYRDIAISRVVSNRYTYLNNRFPVEINIQSFDAEKAKSKLSILHENKIVWSKEISLYPSSFIIPLELEAQQSGIQKYTVQLQGIANEKNLQNNQYSFYIEVLENKQKILIAAQAPHPDLSALKRSLETHSSFQVELVSTGSASASILSNSKKIKEYDLIILHGLPSNNYPLEGLRPFLKDLSLCFFISPSTNLNLFNSWNTGLKIHAQGNTWNEATPILSPNFAFFTLSKEEIDPIAEYPPLWTPFGKFETSSFGESLLTQKILNINTKLPLLWFQRTNQRNIGVFCGCGIWKWRLSNYQTFQNTEGFDNLISKCVQTLAAPKSHSPLIIHCPKLFYTTDPILIEAELYNQAYQNVCNAEIHIDVISTHTHKKYPFVFSPYGKNYSLNAGYLEEGEYTYKAYTTIGKEKLETTGKFSILALSLENEKLPANYELLNNLAKRYNGLSFMDYTQNNWPNLITKSLKSRPDLKPQIHYYQDYFSLLNSGWILTFLLILLSLEYITRKVLGSL